jgi:3-methyl-2-oxobutanoate hydroxymethyltransferase
MADPRAKVRTRHFQQAKESGVRITGLTSYDVQTAEIFDQAGIDFLLVGDSAGNVVLGYDSTVPVTADELIPLTRSVAHAARRAFVIADLPFGSYELGPDQALTTAFRFMKETGAHAVKLEGGRRSEHRLGGHRVQGRGSDAEELIADAQAVEDAGAFAVVLEMVPSGVAKRVTELLSIPTIGVGAGPHVDGQLLVWTDFAGLTAGRIPKFVKQYADLRATLTDAVEAFREDVAEGRYPAPEHEYTD